MMVVRRYGDSNTVLNLKISILISECVLNKVFYFVCRRRMTSKT